MEKKYIIPQIYQTGRDILTYDETVKKLNGYKVKYRRNPAILAEVESEYIRNPLHIAASQCDGTALANLLRTSNTLNLEEQEHGMTPVMRAILFRCTSNLKMLLEHGAKMDTRSDGYFQYKTRKFYDRTDNGRRVDMFNRWEPAEERLTPLELVNISYTDVNEFLYAGFYHTKYQNSEDKVDITPELRAAHLKDLNILHEMRKVLKRYVNVVVPKKGTARNRVLFGPFGPQRNKTIKQKRYSLPLPTVRTINPIPLRKTVSNSRLLRQSGTRRLNVNKVIQPLNTFKSERFSWAPQAIREPL